MNFCPWTVSSELLVFFVFFLDFIVSVQCARLSWPSRQLLSARKYTVSYRISQEIGWEARLRNDRYLYLFNNKRAS